MLARQRSDVDLAVMAVLAGMDVVTGASCDSITRIPKAGNDFATAADLDGEHAIRSVLRDARPDDAIEGEELGRAGEELGRSGEDRARLWRVDPLCGTRNFASGAGDYCVNVALCLSGGPVVSAVGDPRRGLVYWTDGERAGIRDGRRDRPLSPGAQNRIVELNADEPWDVVTSRLLSDRAFREWMTPRVSATTLVLAWVAAGHRAAYVNDGHVRDSVHFAAGLALCRGAGCVVTDLQGDSATTGLGLVIAADAPVHHELRAHIDRVTGR